MPAETDIAAIADAGDNTPADVRTALTSVLARADGSLEAMGRASSVFAPGGSDDDEFQDSGLTGWTEVKPTTTSVFVERYGRANWRHKDTGHAGTLHALLKPITIATTDYIETFVKINRRVTTDMGVGVIMSDGATYGAGNQVVTWMFNGNAMRVEEWDNFTTQGVNSTDTAMSAVAGDDGFYMRLRYEAANTWGGYASRNGFEWMTLTTSLASTMTPTHAGIVVVRWAGTAHPAIFPEFHYFRVNPANEP